jgi:hypothetical protein
MLKGSFRFFLCLVLFSAPAFILALDPILTGAGLYGLNHPRRNHPPVVEDQYVVAKAGKEKVIILRAKDVDGDRLKYKIVSWPKHGKLKGDLPVVKYLPDAGFSGRDRFTFKAEDRQAKSNLGTVRIAVKAVNHAPHARDQVVKTGSDQPVEITLQATDRDRDKLTFRIVKDPAHGALSGTPPVVTYTSNPGYQGWDRFFFRANDGKVDSKMAKVFIHMVAGNHAPVAQSQSVSMDEGTTKAILLSATDSDGDTLTYQVVSQPSNGTLGGTPPSVTYTPSTGYLGPDSFAFKTDDGKMDSNIAIVSITVLAVNHAPVAQNQSVSTEEGSPKAVTLMATDSDGDDLTYQVVSQPANGILSGMPPEVTYTPHARYQGSDSFTFSAYDGQAYSNAAAVSITVTPAANRLSITFPQDGDTVQKSDMRVEGMIVNGGGGEIGVVVNGILANIYGDTFVANHVPLVEGANTISATATDVQGDTATVTVTVNMVPAKDYIRMRASSEAGVGPFETYLTLDSSLDLTNASVTYEGTGEVELVKIDTKEYRANMQAEGIYTFTARISDAIGTIYEDKIDIIAVSKAELENRLVGKWEGMKGALLSGDMEGALSFFVPGAQDRYRQVFEELGTDRISSIFSAIIRVELDTASGRAAEGGLVREENGATYSYPITFVQDQNGIWKIMGF